MSKDMQKKSNPRPSAVNRNKGSFHFIFRFGLAWLLTLLLSGQPAMLSYAFAAESGKSSARSKMPTPAPSPAPVQQSNVDLTVTAINTSDVITDSQTLAISGNLEVTVQNLGSSASNTQFTILAFEDRNLNGKYDSGTDLQLGFTLVSQNIVANSSTSVSIALSAAVTFKGNLIYVFADSGNAIQEINEGNNVLHTQQSLSIVANQFNTGVDSTGTVLPVGAIDPHYRITESADPTYIGKQAYVVEDSPWFPNSSTSKWISVNPNRGTTIGNYAYETIIDLGTTDPTTTAIYGRWSSDNNGLDIKINGQSTGQTTSIYAYM